MPTLGESLHEDVECLLDNLKVCPVALQVTLTEVQGGDVVHCICAVPAGTGDDIADHAKDFLTKLIESYGMQSMEGNQPI